MGFIGIDYWLKRVGISTSILIDDLKDKIYIAKPLCTISPQEVINFIDNYSSNKKLEAIIIGVPCLQASPFSFRNHVLSFIEKLKVIYQKKLEIIEVSERCTSKLARIALVDAGYSKKTRQTKSNVDMISAAIILQSYLDDLK